MSLEIIRTGILDTIQDCGRQGFQHLGINPDGAMDRFSAQLANALLGKELSSPVIEMHFPAAQIRFEKDAVICLSGADFSPSVNDEPVPCHHPLIVSKNSVLKFNRLLTGARCYLSVWNELDMKPWMNSYSTNLKAGIGGWNGNALQKNDRIGFKKQTAMTSLLKGRSFLILPWKSMDIVDSRNEIEFIIGSEWFWLTKEAQESFQNNWYQISNEADRMGYRLASGKLELKTEEQLISSAVSFGTVQMLPSGQLIILMADHQTTGGYPRIAHIISAHLPILAQKKPNDVVKFVLPILK